jgi:hypothetical protein
MGKKCYVLLCPPLQTAPPTGEAAKLASDVAQITSYRWGKWTEITAIQHGGTLRH